MRKNNMMFKDSIQLFIWGCLIVIPWLHKEIDIKNFGNIFKMGGIKI